jgi:hypothetical protein
MVILKNPGSKKMYQKICPRDKSPAKFATFHLRVYKHTRQKRKFAHATHPSEHVNKKPGQIDCMQRA